MTVHPVGKGGAERYETLYRLLCALSRATTLEDVYAAALASLLEATEADRSAILLFDDSGIMRFTAVEGLSAEYQAAVTGHSPWRKGSRNAQPVTVPDGMLDESLAAYRELLAREGIRGLAFVPLALDAGVFGKLCLYYKQPHQCSADELEIATAIAAHIALATEHKRAELARARSEQRLQLILDNSAAVVFLKDLEGRYQLVNRRWEELFHVGGNNVIGHTDFDLFPADVAVRFQANDHAVLEAGRALSIEESAPQDDGIHTYICIKFPLETPNGTITGVCGIATDITDRLKLESAERHLAAIVAHSDDAIVSKDLNGTVTSWNQGAERIFGYTPDEMVGRPVAILADPDHPDDMQGILARIREGHSVDHYETRRRRKDGVIIDVSLTVSPVCDATGRIVGASKIAREITDRKRAEQERTELLAREREARQTAEVLNRVGPRLGAHLELEKLFQEVTDIARELTGAEFGAFFHNVGNERGDSYMLSALAGMTREAFAGLSISRNTELILRTFRSHGAARCDDAAGDPQFSGIRGDVRSYLAAPVISRSGEVLGAMFFGHTLPGRFNATHEEIVTGIAAQAAIAMDNARLFEQSQWVQAELKRSNEELRRANRDLEVFAYSASHDLQEPLRTIAISAQLIESRGERRADEENAGFLQAILGASRRMSVLIQDLLAYTRATKYEEGPPTIVDAARVFAGVVQDLRGSIDEAGARVTAGELPTVAIHESRLAQLFQNLIGNAIKYRSEEVSNVHVTAEERNGWCVFSVVDNGIGIDPRYAEQIFGLFKRLHGRDEYPGSGVGLAICQRIVEQYGGRIWLERSAPGEGATFCFSIPSRARE